MGLMQALQNSALAEWLSVSMLGAPTLIAIHSVGMAVAVGLALIVAMRLNGWLGDLSARQLGRLLDVALGGFALNFITGLGIFVTRAAEYVVSYMFMTKMLFVILSIGTLLLLRERLGRTPTSDAYAGADAIARRLSLASVAFWFGAVISGRLIAYLSELYR